MSGPLLAAVVAVLAVAAVGSGVWLIVHAEETGTPQAALQSDELQPPEWVRPPCVDPWPITDEQVAGDFGVIVRALAADHRYRNRVERLEQKMKELA